jgi:hypothetical protein
MRITKPDPHPTQTVAPIHTLTGEALARVLAALPPLLPDAPPEWHRSRQKKTTREIAAFHAVDALQAQLAGQIVLLRHLATTEMAWARLQTLPPEIARLRARAAAGIMAAGDRTEHELRLLQKRPLPPAGAPTTNNPAQPPPNASLRRNAIRPEPHRAPAPPPTQAPPAHPARAPRPPRPATKPTRAAA